MSRLSVFNMFIPLTFTKVYEILAHPPASRCPAGSQPTAACSVRSTAAEIILYFSVRVKGDVRKGQLSLIPMDYVGVGQIECSATFCHAADPRNRE
jgi:hypothetical protein